MASAPHYKRVLIKLSGEALLGEGQEHCGIEAAACQEIAQSIKTAHDQNVEIGVVIGGGNLFRGRTLTHSMKIPKIKADQIGMLATLLNGLVLSQALENSGCPSKVLSSFPAGEFIEAYSHEKAMQAFKRGEIVIFVGGTSHPFFTTDTAASLRALEIGADALLKATKVDGVYNADPKEDHTAKRYDQLTYKEVLEKNLQVMDGAAISLCRENNLPIVVFDMYQKDNLIKVIQNEKCGTLVKGDQHGD